MNAVVSTVGGMTFANIKLRLELELVPMLSTERVVRYQKFGNGGR